MDRFIIQGGRKLSGEIKVMGAKNSVGPIIAATILISGECILHNVPRIGDAEVLLSILKDMGAAVSWLSNSSLRIDCTGLDVARLDPIAVKRIRLSVLLMGSLASRFKKVTTSVPGGCNLGNRSLDAHFDGFGDLGYTVTVNGESIGIEQQGRPRTNITMAEFSVTATENMLLASVVGDHSVTFYCCAADPQVQDLCWFLQQAGARIDGVGTHTLTVRGVERLKPVEYTIMPDPLEVGTFIALAGATKSKISIVDAAPEFLRLPLLKFEAAGLTFTYENMRPAAGKKYEIGTIIPQVPHKALTALSKIHTMPYPGFLADIIQPFAVLMTQASGMSLIHDWMYDGRQRYASELQKMGASITVLDPHRILIVGPTPLYGKDIVSYDIRAGATVVIAGLLAQGETRISGIDQIDRGYEALDTRLRSLGALIERVAS